MMNPVPLRGGGRPHNKDNSPDELHMAVLTGRCNRIKKLLRKGVHIESVNCHGQTPLFCASWGGDTEVVQLLLGLGANPNRRCGSSGATPVHAATYRGSRRVLRLLIEAGADLSLKDRNNLSLREYAEKQPSPLRRQKIIAFLDLVLAMTLHRGRPLESRPLAGLGLDTGVPPTPANTLSRRPAPGFAGVNKDASRLTDSRLSLNKSSISLSRKGLGSSVTSVWAACVGVTELPRDKSTAGGGASLANTSSSTTTSSSGGGTMRRDSNNDLTTIKPTPSVANLHKSVSCHLVDQLCVTTSLPLLSPTDLQRPMVPGLAYTCGGPTVYSPYTWLGTPVTVRRPTPALTIARDQKATARSGKPDQCAVLSLLEELAILRRLRHPAFLEVMAACHVTSPTPDHVTLVFQHVPHGSLYHHLHVMHRDLSVGGAVEMLVGVVEGLLFLHAHGWLHSGLSSHALHLVSTNHAKLGSFQHAIQQQAKGGCSMKADELGRATWLVPWQAPEILAEAMVSVKSEVYALAAIIWEIWSGMPPWSGVPEEDIKRRVVGGESLPYLRGTPPSLVMYLTQYGLKWNAHERDLDLHEIHTMLRSLRVQVDDDERVPAVPSWGPPSVPNTPVIGRVTQQIQLVDKPTLMNSSNERRSDQGVAQSNLNNSNNNYSLYDQQQLQQQHQHLQRAGASSSSSYQPSTSVRSSSEIHPSQYLQFVAIDQSMLSSSSSCSSVHAPGSHAPPTNFNLMPSQKHVQPSTSTTAFTLPAKSQAVPYFGENNSVSSARKPLLLTTTKPEGANHSVPLQRTAVEVHSPPAVVPAITDNTSKTEKDSGFTTPCTRTPSPSSDTVSSAKTALTMITSTPNRAQSSSRRDLPPDLLPSKFMPSSFMQPITPDILSRGKQGSVMQQQQYQAASCRPHDLTSNVSATKTKGHKPIDPPAFDKTTPASDSEADLTQDFAYITNSAKRAFFTDSEGSKSPSPTNDRTVTRTVRRHKVSVDNGRSSSKRESSTSSPAYDSKEVVKERVVINEKQQHRFEAQDTKGPAIRSDVVRRGLSLSNLLNIGGGSMVTRTFSHVSLCSAESSATSSSSSGGEGRRPQRTISQVTLTFKKLSTADSSSSSSRDELEQASSSAVTNAEDKSKSSSRYRRSKSLPKPPQNIKSPRQCEEVTAIKPASHQLTRHSSSCSLSSGGPPSPVHQFVGGPAHSLLAGSAAVRSKHGSLPTSPQHGAMGSSSLSRPSSLYSAAGGSGVFGSTVSVGEPASIRVNARRHSDAPKPRPRRVRRKPDIEPEEEFIDDEFNAALYEQPHMQLSVGSSENLLDTRLSATSMMADDSVLFQCSPGAPQQHPQFCSVTSAPSPGGELHDLVTSRLQYLHHSHHHSPRHTPLNALPENSDEDLSLTFKDTSDGKLEQTTSTAVIDSNGRCGVGAGASSVDNEKKDASPTLTDKNSKSCLESPIFSVIESKDVSSVSDTDSIFSCSPAMSDLRKDYEPLKSVQLLKSMGKGLSLYLPKHSIGSDSEVENL